jgi:hypothetical protein
MDRFLTNSKKRKVEITNNDKSKAYETEKRKRVFIPSWTTTYPWLQPIFVLFDWPDRKYTGHGPAVTSTPAYL